MVPQITGNTYLQVPILQTRHFSCGLAGEMRYSLGPQNLINNEHKDNE